MLAENTHIAINAIALIILATPPILMNTVTGLKQVPAFLIEPAHLRTMNTDKIVWGILLAGGLAIGVNSLSGRIERKV